MGSVGNKQGVVDFSDYSVTKGNVVKGTYRELSQKFANENKQHELELQNHIDEAKKAGYEIITKTEKHMWHGQEMTSYTQTDFEAPIKSGQPLSKSTNVYKMAKQAMDEYNDVIILQKSLIQSSWTKGHHGWHSKDVADFVILGKGKKG